MKIQEDKILHFGVSLLLALMVSTLAGNLFPAVFPYMASSARAAWCYIVSIATVVAVGVGKEVRDSRQAGNHFCWKDLAADVAGAAIGSLGSMVTFLV